MDTGNTNTHRSGQYLRQLAGYRAFIPKPLPPNPPIQMGSEIQKLLSRADRALGRLDGATEILPNPDLFVAMYVRKEAVLSSQIEGTQASLIDILEFESDAMVPDNPQDIAEVVNYIDALNYGLQRLETLPISLRLIREIHNRLMANVRGADKHPGEFRSSQNWIGHLGSTIETAKYVPPPVPDMKQALSDLEHFLHEDETLPLLIKVGLVHAQFETVHPFLDGNGRMGRLLITFLLCQEGALRRPLLYLSHFFKQNKQEYYEHLQRVRDEGDWESWLKFFLNGVDTVAQQATYTARNIVHLRERHRTLIMEKLGSSAGSALRLLEHLYKRPIINVNRAADVLDRKYPNASRIVTKLQELGILIEMTEKQRNRMYMYDEYFNMLEQEPPIDAMSANEGEATT